VCHPALGERPARSYLCNAIQATEARPAPFEHHGGRIAIVRAYGSLVSLPRENRL